jgi:hypothetical protein
MTEGYASGRSHQPPEPRQGGLTRASRDEAVNRHPIAMRYRQGKPTAAAKDVAIRVLAEMVLEHLELSNFVIVRGPPALAHTTTSHHRLPMKD